MMHRLRRYLLRLLFGIGILVLLLVGYTRVRDAIILDAPPVLADIVNLGDRWLHLRGTGLDHDGTAVVLIGGFSRLFPDSGMWGAVQPVISESMRVYAFDYAGYAWGDAHPDSVSHIAAADDLRAALFARGETGDVILVSFASGSLTTLAYYNRYPNVSGIVWLDADVLEPTVMDYYRDTTDTVAASTYTLTDMGLVGLYYQISLLPDNRSYIERVLPSNTDFDWAYYDRVDATRSTTKVLNSYFDHLNNYADDLAYAADLPLPDDIPLVVLQSDMLRLQSERDPERYSVINTNRAPIMQAWYENAANNSADGSYQFIADSEHHLMVSNPQAVIDAILMLHAEE